MKKLVAILVSLLIAVTVFAACSKQEDTADHGNETEAQVHDETVITTDAAVIKNLNAISYIKQYSAEELSLSQEDYDNCSFMVAGEGYEIEGDYYVKVAVVNKISNTDESGKETFTFDSKGEYFIRYDGKRVLKKDMTSAEPKYDDMEVKEITEDMTVEATTAAATEAATE